MASWLPIPEDSDFSLCNLPYGVLSTVNDSPRIGVAIGDHVVDLKALANDHIFDDLGFDTECLQNPTLNAYAALGRGVHRRVRSRLQDLLGSETKLGSELRDNANRRKRCLVPMKSITMHTPVAVGNFTDGFVGLYHAENSAGFLKPGSSITELIPSFWDAPTAYQGRASSVVVSGTPIHRPRGQTRVNGKAISGHCQKLDFEVEFAAIISQGNDFGDAIDVDQADDHIFGYVLLNDWSARDFQQSEFGPFTCKNFATSISPWVVPFEALEPFHVPPTKADRPLPNYLFQKEAESAYDIPIRATLEVAGQKYQMSRCNTKHVVFSFAQIIAHHTRGGCPLVPGDIIATGTMSGPSRPEFGCFMELSRVGTEAYGMEAVDDTGLKISRTYLKDGDAVEFTCQLRSPDVTGRVGFGACRGGVLPGK